MAAPGGKELYDPDGVAAGDAILEVGGGQLDDTGVRPVESEDVWQWEEKSYKNVLSHSERLEKKE